MKKSILLTCLASTLALTGYTHAEDTNKATTEQEVGHVAKSLEGKLQILKDDKYVPHKASADTEYYLVYYTASW
ncbi:hypothetical protein [Rubritalea tangerina]|uniref:Uncharacterized protein n=1 Tax=Rubritalea tangerina TaxID=430798 RepID=A0ABW4ZCB9_9BACT